MMLFLYLPTPSLLISVPLVDEEGISVFDGPGETMVRTLQGTTRGIDEQLQNSSISLLPGRVMSLDPRERRPALGPGQEDSSGDEAAPGDVESDDGDDDDDDDDDDKFELASNAEDEEEEDEDNDDLTTSRAGKWRESIMERTMALFKQRTNMMEVVYGDEKQYSSSSSSSSASSAKSPRSSQQRAKEDEDEDDDLFVPVKSRTSPSTEELDSTVCLWDAPDNVRCVLDAAECASAAHTDSCILFPVG